VTVIDGAADAVLSTIEVGNGPMDFAWNPVQNRVYVANSGGGSVSVLRDSGGAAVGESPTPVAAGQKPVPSIIRRVLFLPQAADLKPQVASLLDAAGRKTLDLSPGANDVRALAPGIYFVRGAVSGHPSAVTKVVITR